MVFKVWWLTWWTGRVSYRASTLLFWRRLSDITTNLILESPCFMIFLSHGIATGVNAILLFWRLLWLFMICWRYRHWLWSEGLWLRWRIIFMFSWSSSWWKRLEPRRHLSCHLVINWCRLLWLDVSRARRIVFSFWGIFRRRAVLSTTSIFLRTAGRWLWLWVGWCIWCANGSSRILFWTCCVVYPSIHYQSNVSRW